MSSSLYSWKTLNEVTGGLSKPSKMPCHGYSLPATRCKIGSILRKLAKKGIATSCGGCYALKGRYVFPNVQKALENRYQCILKFGYAEWSDAMRISIDKTGDQYFRWHDSGDLIDLGHLEAIVAIAIDLPTVNFWLPTREAKTVLEYRRAYGDFPDNLCVRLSATLVDSLAGDRYGLPTSAISRDKALQGHLCPANKQGNKCGACRACWNSDVSNVVYPYH